MIRAVGVLTVVVVALLTIHEAHGACDPNVGCDNKDSVCVKFTSFLSTCTNLAAGLATTVGYCDVNHQTSCGTGQKCDLNSGKCVHFCTPYCTTGASCEKVWVGLSSSYKCVSKSFPCGGACDNGGKCVLGHVCLKLPSLLQDLSKALAFAADTTFSAIAGFFTSGRKVELKDASTAQAGDVVSVTTHAQVTCADGVALDTREANVPELNLTLKSAYATPQDDEQAAAPLTGPTTDTDGVTPDPDEHELPDTDYLNDTKVPTNEQGEPDLPPPTPAADASTQSDRARLQGIQEVVKSARMLLLSMQRVTASIQLAIFDAFTLALNTGMTVMRKMHVKKGNTVHIGGSGGDAQQALLSAYAPHIHLQDVSTDTPSRVAFPEQLTGDCNDSSVVFNFMGPVRVAHHHRNHGVQSLMNITVQNNDEVSVEAGVRLAHNGTVLATHPRGHFRLHPGAHMRYTGPRFMTGLKLHADSHFNITMRGAQMDRVAVYENSNFRVATHHVLNFPDSYRNAYMKTLWLNDDDAIVIGRLDACHTGAKLIFHVKGSFLDEIDEISGTMLKFNTALNDTDLANFNCSIVIEDSYGDQKTLNLVKMDSSVSTYSRQARVLAVRNKARLQARAKRAKLLAKSRVRLQDDTASSTDGTTDTTTDNTLDSTSDSTTEASGAVADTSALDGSLTNNDDITDALVDSNGVSLSLLKASSDDLSDYSTDDSLEAGDDGSSDYSDTMTAAPASSSGSGALIGLGVAIALVAVGGGSFLFYRQRQLNKLIAGPAPAHDAHVVKHTHEEDLEMAQKKPATKAPDSAAAPASRPSAASRPTSPAPNAAAAASPRAAQPRAASPQPNALSPRAAPTLPARPASPQAQPRAPSPRPQQARAPSPAPVPRPPSRNQ